MRAINRGRCPRLVAAVCGLLAAVRCSAAHAGFMELASTGQQNFGNYLYSQSPLISPDATTVTFFSSGPNGSPTGWFVRDPIAGTTVVATNPHPYSLGTPDGRYVVVSTTNPMDSLRNDLFVYDTVSQTTDPVSVTNGGADITTCNSGFAWGAYAPSISDDGRYVVFWSNADNLPDGTVHSSPNCDDVFIRDRCVSHGAGVPACTPTTALMETGPGGAVPHTAICAVQSNHAISGDGRFVVFECDTAHTAVYDPGNASCSGDFCAGIYLRDRCLSNASQVPSCTASTILVSQTTSGGVPESGGPGSAGGIISADGSRIFFFHPANNIVTGDTEFDEDVFLYDRTSSSTQRITPDQFFATNASFSQLSTSSNGLYTAVTRDQNGPPADANVYLWGDCAALGPTCGDGHRVPACEECDDGNLTDGDGCDSNCTITRCGNGITTANTGELCDDGNFTDGDGCDSNCTPTGCGNGIRTAGEACEDGNLVAGDGCSPTCTIEPDELTPGGTTKTDCYHEWLPRPQPLKNSKGIPKNHLECTDDDATCDFGSAHGDHQCTFDVALCFNVTDSRLVDKHGAPKCTPLDVTNLQVIKPADRTTYREPVEQANRQAIDQLLSPIALYAGVCTAPKVNVGMQCGEDFDCDDFGGDGRCASKIYNMQPPISATNTCTGYVGIRVPLKQKKDGSYKSGTVTLSVKALPSIDPVTSKARPGDGDTLTLKCNP